MYFLICCLQDIKRREDAVSRSGVPDDDKNWPQSKATVFGFCKLVRGILAAIDVFNDHVLVGIFYLVGFGLFCLESLLLSSCSKAAVFCIFMLPPIFACHTANFSLNVV
ncbi:uncharacterized protein LOC132177941 [Corylus avellana]|uniref:uncharacterized protein LOC132177941 n=1 Tax=Corylus avellana TaxID=13451 RepID=UPI00286A8B66|nr:uncharacterized protein LOC132177941 [Corylus avellana]